VDFLPLHIKRRVLSELMILLPMNRHHLVNQTVQPVFEAAAGEQVIASIASYQHIAPNLNPSCLSSGCAAH